MSTASPSSAVAEVPVASHQHNTPSFFFPISVNAFLTVSPRFIAKEMTQQELDSQLTPTGGDDDSKSLRTSTAANAVMQFRHICELPDATARVTLISRYQNNIFKGDGSVAEGCCYLLSAAEQDLYTHKMKGHLQQQQLQQREVIVGQQQHQSSSSPLSNTTASKDGASSTKSSLFSTLESFLRTSEEAISGSNFGKGILPGGLFSPVDYCFTCPISSTAHKSCERFSIVAKETGPSPTVLRVGFLLAHLFCHRYFRAVYQNSEEAGRVDQEVQNIVTSKEWLSEMEFYNIKEDSKTVLRAQGVPLSNTPATSNTTIPSAARFGRHNVAAIIAAGVLQAAKMYRQQPQVNLPFMLHVIHERAVMYDSILQTPSSVGGGTETVEDAWMDQVVSYEMAIFQLVSSSQPLRDLVPPEGYIRELLARMQPVLDVNGSGKLPSVVKEVVGRVAMKILEVAYMDPDLIYSGCSTQTLVGTDNSCEDTRAETMQGEQDHSVRFVRGPISRVTETLVARARAAEDGGRVRDPTTKEGESVPVPHGGTYDAAVCSVLLAVCGLINTASTTTPDGSSSESDPSPTGNQNSFPFPSMVWGVAGCSGSQLDEPCIKDAPAKWRETLSYFREFMRVSGANTTVTDVHNVLLKAALVPKPGASIDDDLFDTAKVGAMNFYSRLREVSRINVLQERLRFLHTVSPAPQADAESADSAAIVTASSVHAAHFTRDLVEGSKLTDLPFSDPIILDPKPSGCGHQEPASEPSSTSASVYNSSVAQKVRGKLLEDSPRLLLRRPFSVPVIPLGGMSEMQRAYLTWYEFYLVGWASALLPN